MPAFSQIVGERAKPAPRTVDLDPSSFVEGWTGTDDDPWEKPDAPVTVGLRPVSQDVIVRARSDAAKTAWRRHPDREDEEARIEAYNDALIGCALTTAVCDPEDVSKPLWPIQQAVIECALTPEAQRHLWEELEVLHVCESPIVPEATDEELHELAQGILSGDVWNGLELRDAQRIKRLLKHTIDEL